MGEKAKAVMNKVAGSDWPRENRENIAAWKELPKDSAAPLWLKLCELGLGPRLSSVFNLPEGFPGDIRKLQTTDHFCYAGGLYRTKFFAFFLLNGFLALVLQQEY